jgi:outer membrane protein assembly factor BamE
MKKLLCLMLFSFCLSSCAYFHAHQRDIEQGNVWGEREVRALRLGMTETEVKHIMGEPIMKHLFTGDRLVYVYSMQRGGEARRMKKLICRFKEGRLQSINPE